MTARRKTRSALAVLALGGIALSGPGGPVSASSHREAPLISQDPVADLTDLYAFVSPDRPDSLTFVMNAIPFEQPGGGPNFYQFGDDVLYSLNVDTNGDANRDLEYQFRFTTKVVNPNTFLYNTNQVTSIGDPDLSVQQSYSVTEVDYRKGYPKKKTLGRNLPVPPANVGVRSTPDYEANLGSSGVKDIGNGIKAFAGPRDDPFFADLGSIFDLGGLRPFNTAHLIPLPTAAGEDYLSELNVHSIAIQIPKARIVGADPVIGVYATTSRRFIKVLSDQGTPFQFGPWVQVSRLGNPLVNEVVIPRGSKDRFNASSPCNDLQFLPFVLKSELGSLIPVLYPGVNTPTNVSAGLGTGGREDLATIFLTGIPGVNKPVSVKPSEMLRLNTTSAVSAFPDGRSLTDDVIDTAIRVVAGATPFSPEFNIAPNNQLGDGVDANDKPLSGTFPYVAAPWSGYGENQGNNS